MMKFEVGKCYKHTTGQAMKCLCEANTMCYGHCILAEFEDGHINTVGMTEDYAVNYQEITESEWESHWENIKENI